jgi:hypothetical protein
MFLLLALLATHVLAQGDGTCTPLPGLATSFLLAVPEGQPREVVAARDVKCFANMTACDGMYCMPEGGTCCNKCR